MDKDVTDLMSIGTIDDELLSIAKCICGKEFYFFEFYISIHRDTPYSCPHCGRKFYFKTNTRIYEVDNGPLPG